jgi:hypothetical protein
MVYVPGRGWNLAADTGRTIKGHRLDLLFPTHAEARAYGTRYIPVTVTPYAEYRRQLESALLDLKLADLIRAGRHLIASTYRRADGTLELISTTRHNPARSRTFACASPQTGGNAP